MRRIAFALTVLAVMITVAAASYGRVEGPKPADILLAQQLLKERGFYSGPTDGLMRLGTQDAIRRFQRQSGLAMTADLDAETLLRLSEPAPAIPTVGTTIDSTPLTHLVKG